jgi:orotidine-5'-phosphate decarboxylase
MTNAADKIIVALDVGTRKEALTLVKQLRDQISLFKIGLQLYTAEGPDVVRDVIGGGGGVFLDLKLHDIPTTVAKSVESAGTLGVRMLTIHLSGGEEMIRAAVNAGPDDLLLLGVTVLTSADEKTLTETGVSDTIENHVLRLGGLGVVVGIRGLVASPREIKSLRKALGEKITIVTPGIRPSWSEAGDQKRIMTPRQALDAGADYLVIGRPITADRNPGEAVQRIVEELAA